MRPRLSSNLLPAVLLAVAALAPHAGAQVPSLPLFHEPFRAPTGVDRGVLLTVGQARPDDDSGGAFAWTLSGRYRLAPSVTVTGAAGTHALGGTEGGTRAHLGGTLDLLVAREPLSVSLVGGGGYARAREGGVLSFPLGVGVTRFRAVTATGAGPQLGFWAMPRAELLRRSAGAHAATDLTWGGSAGVAASGGAALGLSLGADYRRVPSTPETSPALPRVPRWSFALLVRLWQ
jgi:hypothetical protein